MKILHNIHSLDNVVKVAVVGFNGDATRYVARDDMPRASFAMRSRTRLFLGWRKPGTVRIRAPSSRTPSFEALEERWVPAATAGCTVPEYTCFAVIGDYGEAGQAAADVADLVKSWNPDFIITTGDNNYPDGEAATIDQNIGQYYHEFISPYLGAYGPGATTNRFFPSLGNHDWHTNDAQPYLDYFTLGANERYYDFTHGPVEFFVLDSDPREPDGRSSSSTQAAWLKGQLAASNAVWKIVYFHHPPYSSGFHGSTTTLQWPFKEWGASAVLSGHDHDYERIMVDGFPYFVNGVGGASLRSFGITVPGSEVQYADDYGAMLVTANDTDIIFQFITRTGAVIDTFAMDPPFPTITLVASDQVSSESGNDTGTITISRTGDTSKSLAVSYKWGGTTTYGTDISKPGSTVTIPVGATSARVRVKPRDDSLLEGNETVLVRLLPSSSYALGSSHSAAITLRDNDVSSETLISAGSTWKYSDYGLDLGTAWRESSFDDSTWSSGLAQLGYGDGDEITTVSHGPDSNNKFITTYLRNSFTVPDVSNYTGLNLRLLRDDGAVVYLNGTEVVRSNMPTGSISYTTRASSSADSSSENTFYEFAVDPRLLRTGSNVVAVEVHQRSPSNVDLSFDLELIAHTITLLPAGATWKYLDTGSDQGTAWRGVAFSDSTWRSGPAQLGYGDGDEATVVGYGPDPRNRHVTTYFRSAFKVLDASRITALTLRILRDDGAVVYLNGIEILRSNMPAGTMGHTTLAASWVDSPEENTFFETPLSPNLLLTGVNVIAVELHQRSVTSADISFDLAIIGSVV